MRKGRAASIAVLLLEGLGRDEPIGFRPLDHSDEFGAPFERFGECSPVARRAFRLRQSAIDRVSFLRQSGDHLLCATRVLPQRLQVAASFGGDAPGDATGVRIRRSPMNSANVRAAFKLAGVKA